jgi:hypothetical protein
MDPGRVINTSSTASVVAGAEGGALSEKGHGTWSCTFNLLSFHDLAWDAYVHVSRCDK